MEASQGNKLTRNSSGNAQPQSSQLAEPLWTDPGIKSGIGVHEPISVKENKAQAGIDASKIFPQNPCMREKSHHHMFGQGHEDYTLNNLADIHLFKGDN